MMFESVLMQIAADYGMKIDELCFTVCTRDFDFPFSYFAFENDEFLGILVTDENGHEKLHLLVKSEVVYLKIMYLDDIYDLFDDGTADNYGGVNIYE